MEDDDDKKIVANINTKLEKAGTRIQGLEDLSKDVSKVSKESLTKNFTHWMATVTQVLSKAQANPNDLVIVCKATGSLVEACKKVPELDKQVSITSVKQLVGILVEQYSQEKSGATLYLAIMLLYHYPESCARFQASFSKLISYYFNEEKGRVVESSARCYSVLVRAVEKSFMQISKNSSLGLPDNSPSGCYVFHQINLCNNLQNLMDTLFQDVVITENRPSQEYQNLKGVSLLHLKDISCHEISEYYLLIERRFTNLCIFLSHLLRAGGKGGKNCCIPNELLRVICRGLGITPPNLQKCEEGKKQFLLNILPKLHIGLLNVLGALITSFRDSLISLGVKIQRLILQMLEWTRDAFRDSHLDESVIKVRNLAYSTLKVWLDSVKHSSGFHSIAEEFLPHFVKDISPPNINITTLTTKVQKNPSKYHSSPKNSKVQNSNGCSIKNNIPVYNCHSCAQALKALQSILTNCSCYLKSSFYENVRNVVESLLYQHYIKKTTPYSGKSNIANRLLLLETLRSFMNHPHSSSANGVQYAIQIFGLAQSQECDAKFSQVAADGICAARFIIQPSAPTLTLSQRPPSPTSSRSSRSSSRSSSPSSRSLTKSPNPMPHQSPDNLREKSEEVEIISRPSSDEDEEMSEPKKPKLEIAEEKKSLKSSSPKPIVLGDSPDRSNAQEREDDELLLTFCDVLQDDEDDLLGDDDDDAVIISN